MCPEIRSGWVMKERTKVKTKREELGLTQEQVAEKANISLRAYKMYEAGERIPRADIAILLAKALKSTVEDLFKMSHRDLFKKEDEENE